VALIAGLWFAHGSRDNRERIIVGVCAALVATALSRAIQMAVPIHPRPLLMLASNAVPGTHPLNRLSSFPSDHATFVFGLCAVA
jgi:hypothetical protein